MNGVMADEADIAQMVQMMRRLYRNEAGRMVERRITEAEGEHGRDEEAAYWRRVAEALRASAPDKPAEPGKA
jgi:hypothetical protein